MNIYVGNLDWGVGESDLEEAFAKFGEVDSARVITDRQSGRSKGFGFVEMPNDEEAQAAIDELDGNELKGRAIKVNKAKPKRENNNRRGGGGGGGYRSRSW
ncbi:MAG: RNA recognition motif domain-containing protein [Candidatus Zixiibacteriota bacterium]